MNSLLLWPLSLLFFYCPFTQTNNSIEQCKNSIEIEQIQFIDCVFTNIHGTLHEVTIPIDQFENAVKNGLNFDGSSIPGMTQITESDMVLKLDLDTFTIIPWTDHESKTARVFCDVYRNEHRPYEGDPRVHLKQLLEKTRAQGLELYVGPEVEFFLCNKNTFEKNNITPSDDKHYFGSEDIVSLKAYKCLLMNALLAQAIPVEKIHHEVAAGQHEVSLRYNDALTIADQLIVTKQTIALVSLSQGLHATFMPKPFHNANGSGMHIHFSLWDTVNNQNIFHDDSHDAHLSKTARHFIAGVLYHLHELSAVFNATVNSYKRLTPNFEAPITICWGTKNRSAAIRIPQCNAYQSEATRAEIRTPDGLCNPYLAFAALLHAGLDGIERELPLADAIEENLYRLSEEERAHKKLQSLPSSLENALYFFGTSQFVLNCFGDTLVSEFVRSKQNEVREYVCQITPWEIQKYC